jgi:translation initiation factor 3 subunit D
MNFQLPPLYSHPDGWGPPPDGETNGLPDDVFNCAFEQLDKYPQTRTHRICDFTIQGLKYQEQRAAKGKGKKGAAHVLKPDDEGFALVDNRPVPHKGMSKGGGRGKAKGKGKGIAVNYQEGILGQKQKPFYASNLTGGGGGGKGAKGKQKGKSKGKGNNFPTFKEWSVQTKTEWQIMREIQLSALSKLQTNTKEILLEDVFWCGRLHKFNKDFDRVSVKAERPIRRFEELNFFNVSTSDDPILPELLQSDESCQVIATDHVLACLIAATRSVYSWDIVATKIQGKLIFDKRDGSQIDFLTVNETAREPPNNDSPEAMNSPLKLGQEASCINQNFSQMVLNTAEEPIEMERENPFEEESDGGAASGAYRYRKITIPGNPKDEAEFNQNPVTMIVRCEVNCKMPNEGDKEGSYVSVKALNEFDPKLNYSWRTSLESQRGAVLATELRNNAFKLGRWTAQAILAGCDVMKIGYASRVRPNDPWSHSILGVQTYQTDGFGEQIGMTRNNAYGILRNIIDVLMGYEDGKYLVMKDPTKAVMRIYAVPWETFQDDGGDDDEEEEEEVKELDEDGNEVPQADGLGLGKL